MAQPRSKDTKRRIVGIGVIVLLLAVALVFFAGKPRVGTTPAPATSSSGASSTGASTAGSSTAGSSKQATSSSTRPTAPPSPSGSTQATAFGTGTADIHFSAAPRSDGSWDVIETVRLPRPSEQLRLRRPPINRIGGQFTDAKAVVDDLQVSGGQDVATLEQQGSGWSASVADATVTFELRYLLDGVSVRSVPSTTGRALAALAPLAAPDVAVDRVQIEVKGDAVLNLQCPLLSGDAQLCAAGSGNDLHLAKPLPLSQATALVQYNLPNPQ